MTSQNQFEVHSCSQLMKCAIGDSFKDTQSTSKFHQSKFLLRLYSSRKATVFMFKQQMAGIDQEYFIKQMDSHLCFTTFTRYRRLYIAYTNHNEVVICEFQKKDRGGYQIGKEVTKCQYKFSKGDGFKTFSSSIEILEGQAIIGYSKKGQFYLINFSYHDRKAESNITKLQNLDKTVGLLSWISFKKQVQYKDVNLITFLSSSSNALISILAIRDNTASIFEVRKIQRSNQYTIKLAYECQQFTKILPKQSKFLSYLKRQDNEILAAFSYKEKVLLVKFLISDKDLTLLCYHYKTNIPANESFQMVKCKQLLFLHFNNKQKKNFNCLKTALKNFDHNQSTDFLQKQPFIQTKSPLRLCGNQKELYFFCDHQVYIIEKDHANYDIDSVMKIKLQSFQNSLDRGIGKYIRKNVHQSNYQQLQLNFKEKEERIKEQLEHLQKQGTNLTLYNLIHQKLLCNKIVNIIISSKYFPKLLAILSSKQTKNRLRQKEQQQILTNCLIKQQPKCIGLVLRQISDMNYSVGQIKYLNSILEQILYFPQQLRDHQDLLQQMLSQPCSNAIHQSARENKNLVDIQLLIDYTFKLIAPPEDPFIHDFEIIVKRFNHTVFIRNHIINFTLKQAFCQLFIFTNESIFSQSDAKDIISKLNKDERGTYLQYFFHKLKRHYVQVDDMSEEKMLLKKKIKMLMRVLQPYFKEIEGILQRTFPGLAVYHYSKNDKRRSYDQQINQIIAKCKLPLTAYILKLSLPTKNLEQWKQQLLKIKDSKSIKPEELNQQEKMDIQNGQEEERANQITV